MEQCLADGSYLELAELAGLAEAVEAVLRSTQGKKVDQASLPMRRSAISSGKRSRGKKASGKIKENPDLDVSRADSGAYPHFVKDGDKLVKIAWSAKDNKEYEHRAPRAAISSLIDAIASKAGAGELFHVDGILPVLDEDGTGQLPTYQVYLVLAWLRECGVIEKVGRDQYKLLDAEQAVKTAKRCWVELVSK